jgi:hypothetical protein
VLPFFEGVERISGLVWRTLSQPKLWVDFGLVWRERDRSPVVEEFIAAAERLFPLPDEAERAEI